MTAARILHTATLLPDGRVLATGGYNRSAEFYDPATGRWSRTADAPNTYRSSTATLLLNGKILVAGAGGAEWDSGLSASLYDPASGTWAATGNLSRPRFHHSATLLQDGRVLVVGGADSEYGGTVLASAELYNPSLGTWTPTSSMRGARRNHTATLLRDGRVLVTGGTSSGGTLQNSAELYDPATGTWNAVPDMSVSRAYHSTTLLSDGRVLVAGGGGSDWESSSSAEVFAPGSGTWTRIASMARPRRYHSATLLPTGEVLVAGGFHEYTGILTAAELYDSASGAWRSAGAMATNRYLHTATLLANGRILVAGGFSTGDQASCELYLRAPTAPEDPSEPRGTSLLLQIVDTSGAPIPTAAVSVQDAVFPTDGSGHILFENLPAGRFLARVDALGFSSASAVVELQNGAHVGYQVVLHPPAQSIPFQAEQGGVIETEHVRVTIPSGAVVDALGRPVTGAVQVTITPLDPTSQLADMPGPLEGIPSGTGDIVSLESFFMADVSLWSNGAPVQLAPGASATLEFVLPDSVAGQFHVGDTVPAWWFDLDVGRWRQEGEGTMQASTTQPGKLAWIVQVQHFTWWNCDAPWTDKSCVNVLVEDGSGRPVHYAQVNAKGITYTGISGPVYTGADGRACIEIKRGNTANVYAGLAGQPESAVVTVVGSEEAATCGIGSCAQVTLTMTEVICTPGEYQECPYSGPPESEGKGMCRAGRQQCNVIGTKWSACEGEVLPEHETCTTPFDDNCDGITNEDCSCSSQEDQPCYTGPAGTEGVGICKGGTVACDLFGNVACMGQKLPKPESCSTLEDDDCDGSNECPPTTLRTQKWGGLGNEEARDLTVDSAGNTVLLGKTDGTLEIGGTVITGDTSDLFVAKISPDGTALWAQLIARDGAAMRDFEDGDARVTTDAAGNVLITGTFMRSLSIGGVTLTNDGDRNPFVIKLSPAGDLLWAKRLGGAQSAAYGTGIAAAPNGSIVVIGSFWGRLQLGDTEYVDDTPFGQDLFVVRLDGGTGEPLWSTRFHGEITSIVGVSIDAAENVLVSGSFVSQVNLAGIVLRATGNILPFVAKLNGATGVTLWGRTVVHPTWSSVYSRRLQVDGAGNVLLLSWRDSGDNSTNPLFLSKFDPDGEQLWQAQLPQSVLWVNFQMSLTVDAAGNPLIAGWLVPTAPPQGPAAFLTWYSGNGTYLMDRIFPIQETAEGVGTAMGRAAGTDSNGNAVFAGKLSGGMDFGTGRVQAQGSDIFLLKIDPTP